MGRIRKSVGYSRWLMFKNDDSPKYVVVMNYKKKKMGKEDSKILGSIRSLGRHDEGRTIHT